MSRIQNNNEESEEALALSSRLTDLLFDLAYQQDKAGLQFFELRQGETLFEQGDEAHHLYVLKAGALGVRIKHNDGRESDIARLAPGAIVGEMALLSGNKRSATVFALNDVRLLRVTEEQFQKLMIEDESAFAAMSATAIPRWQRQQSFDALRTLLGDIDVEALDGMCRYMTWQYVANGEVIFHQGDPSDGMYIVVNGRLRATLSRNDGSRQDLGVITPGEPLGEMGVLTEAARSASIHAERESNLLRLTAAQFRRLIRQYPDLIINITRVIVERQRRLMQGAIQARAGSLTIAVIPASIELEASQFAHALGRTLSALGSTQVLDSDGFDEKYGEVMASEMELDDVGNTAIMAWMNALDMAEDFIIYVADPFASPWTRRCIAHADRALILADAAGDPQPGDAERLLDEMQIALPRELFFWQPPATEPHTDISPWLQSRPDATAHFITRDDQERLEEFARLAHSSWIGPG